MTVQTPGLFIVFEGIDGSGKSTQIRLLADVLKKHGLPVIETYEPTRGQFGQKIRALYTDRSTVSSEEELELFIKDRHEHIEKLIAPSLAKGTIVLCDRYFLSSAAYQGAAGLDPDDIISRHAFAPDPDLAIIIEIDPGQSIQRITEQRGDALNEFEQLESLKKVDGIFKLLDLPYVKRIDGSGSETDVHQQILHHVDELLPNVDFITYQDSQ